MHTNTIMVIKKEDINYGEQRRSWVAESKWLKCWKYFFSFMTLQNLCMSKNKKLMCQKYNEIK